MDIEFETKLVVETDYPDLFGFTHYRDLSPFDPEQTYTTTVYNGEIHARAIVASEEATAVTLPGVITNVGHISYADAIVWYLGGQTSRFTLFRIKLGHDKDTGADCYYVVDFQAASLHTTGESYISTNIWEYVAFYNYQGQLQSSEDIYTQSQSLYQNGTALPHTIHIGMAFLTLPGREDGWSHKLLAFFTSLTRAGYESNDFTWQPYNTLRWDLPTSVTAGNDTTRIVGAIDLEALLNEFGMEFEVIEDFSPEVGPASEEEGYDPGSAGFDDSSDTIDIPGLPSIGVSSVGFVNVYKTGVNSLQNMGVELFPPLNYTAPTAITGSDVTEAIVNGFNQIVTFLANIPSFFAQSIAATLINYVIDCHVLPVTPTGGTAEYIKVGYKTLTVQGDRLSSDYVTVDCGDISLAEYYANFADFLTSFKLYLPFVGFVPGRPEWFYRESLNVTYRFNIIDGSFMAYVRSTGKYVNNNNSGKTIVGQYGGNACIHLPITGVTYASMVSGLVGATGGAIAGAASGNVAALATSALAAAQTHGDVAQSNAYASSVAFLGCRRPFALIERPVSNYSKTYQKENGLPSNISRKLSDVSGFSIIGDVHLDGISATDAEKAEIERLLHEGVIL